MLAIIYIGLYSATIAVGLYAIYIGIPFLYARILKRNLVNSPMLQNKLVITLDDGPGKLTRPSASGMRRARSLRAW